MGVGNAKGKDKAEQAAKMAMSSPLLETNISGAKGIIVNITASPDIGLDEIDNAVNMITEEAQPDATIIFGAAFDPSLEDEMKITLIATGFDSNKKSSDAKRQMQAAQAAQAAKTDSKKADDKADSSELGTDDEINNIIEMLNRGRKSE